MIERLLINEKHAMSQKLSILGLSLKNNFDDPLVCKNLISSFIVSFIPSVKEDREIINQLIRYIEIYLTNDSFKFDTFMQILDFNIGLNNFRIITRVCKMLEGINENPLEFLKEHRLFLKANGNISKTILECIDQLIRKYDSPSFKSQLRRQKRELLNKSETEKEVNIKKRKIDKPSPIVSLVSDDEQEEEVEKNTANFIDLTVSSNKKILSNDFASTSIISKNLNLNGNKSFTKNNNFIDIKEKNEFPEKQTKQEIRNIDSFFKTLKMEKTNNLCSNEDFENNIVTNESVDMNNFKINKLNNNIEKNFLNTEIHKKDSFDLAIAGNEGIITKSFIFDSIQQQQTYDKTNINGLIIKTLENTNPPNQLTIEFLNAAENINFNEKIQTSFSNSNIINQAIIFKQKSKEQNSNKSNQILSTKNSFSSPKMKIKNVISESDEVKLTSTNIDTSPEPDYFEFHDTNLQFQLLYSTKDIKMRSHINKVFENGYVKFNKDQKLFQILTKLMKMKDSNKNPNEEVLLDNKKYKIQKQLGAGGFGVVYLATVGSAKKNLFSKAVKFQNCNCDWEFYISRTIVSRFAEKINSKDRKNRTPFWSDCLKNIANPNKAITFKDHSILVMNYIPTFTLLELSNFIKTDVGGLRSESSRDLIATYYTIQLLKTIEALHSIDIIHGDLKADNCMIRSESSKPDKIPSMLGNYSEKGQNGWNERGIFLIDFGKSMDMRLFDDGNNTKFIHNLEKTDEQDCPEIRNMNPFNYEIDYYGIAAISHTLLFCDYIETRKLKQNGANTDGKYMYELKRKVPRVSRDLWPNFFDTFINSKMHSSEQWPMIDVLQTFRHRFEQRILNNYKLHILIKEIEESMKK
ncbi:kinase-like protein [Hanseniaspora valbyensis NRRL Y-1626]|uniref:Kinase-like protein n=1 Tax=Hanseniaspora valbyensis NRRL Y-1626 TaxID=766949 RepID=A0A1B7TJ52_9ASCO|nr:kinase-like protein [Hanseniaspora valbyensis NRRL Y-1626]